VQIWGAIELRRILDDTWLLGLTGALAIAFGVIMIAKPGAGALALVWTIGWFVIVFGGLYKVLRIRSLAVGVIGRHAERYSKTSIWCSPPPARRTKSAGAICAAITSVSVIFWPNMTAAAFRTRPITRRRLLNDEINQRFSPMMHLERVLPGLSLPEQPWRVFVA
jgi:hypothetical protein